MIRLDNVSYTYPFQPDPALRNISLYIGAGEAVLCTGASGCGKSTLIRAVNGLCPHYMNGTLTGSVHVMGQNNADRRLHEISRDVGTLFQDPEQQFFALNVEDELAFAHEWLGLPPRTIEKRIGDASREFGIESLLASSVHDLSEGQKQKVALASIMSLGPKVLILDEPTANLDPESTTALADKIRRLKKMGMAILIVDHRLYWLEGVVDRVVVMEKGRIAETGAFDDVLTDDALTRYGLRQRQVADTRNALADAATGTPYLTAKDIHFSYRKGPEMYGGCSFNLPLGVTGILGNNGVGKTTLARLLTGLNRLTRGELSINGTPLTPKQLLARASIVLQNTDHQLHMKTVRAELDISAHDLPLAERRSMVDALLAEFNIEHLAGRHPQSLSGGEKQRLVIACGMAKRPRIIILDEPTSGLDGDNMRLIARAIHAAAVRGTCIALITHDLELLSGVCDYALRLPLHTNNAIQEVTHA